ncbi:MAG: sugar phosphate nucleotidyltransferase [Candidatus Methylomirabilales bacterium]
MADRADGHNGSRSRPEAPSDGRRGWALILAGGDGTRLRPLTRRIAGDERPKQFCPLVGSETLLDRTRRRTALLVPPRRTLLVLTQSHERFYAPLLAGVAPGYLVVQPGNRSTAPAILYGLLRLALQAPDDPVVILPSDHFFSDDGAFMAHVAAALEAVTARPDLVILLGAAPDSPEMEYGWIEPAEAIPADGPCPLFRVSRFWEKPSPPLAQTLMARGCLWNTFVMVGAVSAFLTLIRSTAPGLYEAFLRVRPSLGTPGEPEAVRALYAALPSMNFSDYILTGSPPNLAVLPVYEVGWSDWGESERVLAALARMGIRPAWAEVGAAKPR